jgi:hypothetical protein
MASIRKRIWKSGGEINTTSRRAPLARFLRSGLLLEL